MSRLLETARLFGSLEYVYYSSNMEPLINEKKTIGVSYQLSIVKNTCN